jgi:hypothetical protein
MLAGARAAIRSDDDRSDGTLSRTFARTEYRYDEFASSNVGPTDWSANSIAGLTKRVVLPRYDRSVRRLRSGAIGRGRCRRSTPRRPVERECPSGSGRCTRSRPSDGCRPRRDSSSEIRRWTSLRAPFTNDRNLQDGGPRSLPAHNSNFPSMASVSSVTGANRASSRSSTRHDPSARDRQTVMTSFDARSPGLRTASRWRGTAARTRVRHVPQMPAAQKWGTSMPGLEGDRPSRRRVGHGRPQTGSGRIPSPSRRARHRIARGALRGRSAPQRGGADRVGMQTVPFDVTKPDASFDAVRAAFAGLERTTSA